LYFGAASRYADMRGGGKSAKESSMKAIAMAVALAAVSAIIVAAKPAYAQDKTPPQLIDEAARLDRAEVDKRYNATVRQTSPKENAKIDPWRTIRPAETANRESTATKKRSINR
jgi:hypothetical protein